MPDSVVTRFLPVAGTHGWRGQQTGGWWQAGSPWLAELESHGFVPYNSARPFVWSTNLDGHTGILRRWLRKLLPFVSDDTRHLVWEAAGLSLYAYLVPPIYGGEYNGVNAAPTETRIVCHSHGAQIVAFACAAGLKVDRLITVGSPIRADMAHIYDQARDNIGYWLHLHSDHTDRWQWLGSIGDGVLGVVREHPWADDNQAVRHVGHSGILTDEDGIRMWHRFGWLEVLRG